jgi:hypothetical protein
MDAKEFWMRSLAVVIPAGALGACDASTRSDAGAADLATGGVSASGYDASLIPKSVPAVTPLPGTNCPMDALCDPPVWPDNVDFATLMSLGCVTGTVTSVGAPESFVAPIREEWGVGAVALCRGQTFEFQPDGVIAIDWIERSWAAGWFEATVPPVTSSMWIECPLAYVDLEGAVVEIPDQPPSRQGDLRGAPPGLEPGQSALFCYGFAPMARPGDADYALLPAVAALLPFSDDGVKQGDGTTLSISDTLTAIEAGYDKAAKDYANTPKPR